MRAGIPSVSITTGSACHLDAELVHRALHGFPVSRPRRALRRERRQPRLPGDLRPRPGRQRRRAVGDRGRGQAGEVPGHVPQGRPRPADEDRPAAAPARREPRGDRRRPVARHAVAPPDPVLGAHGSRRGRLARLAGGTARRCASLRSSPGCARERSLRGPGPGRLHGRKPPHARAGPLGPVRRSRARPRLVRGTDAPRHPRLRVRPRHGVGPARRARAPLRHGNHRALRPADGGRRRRASRGVRCGLRDLGTPPGGRRRGSTAIPTSTTTTSTIRAA